MAIQPTDNIIIERGGAHYKAPISQLPVSGGVTWDYYATNWTEQPALLATIASGNVYSYTLRGITRYRLVPSPFLAANDVFYSSWNGSALSGLIVARG